MSQVYLIYKHTSPIGKAYIGMTFDYQRRCYEHKNQKRCLGFYNAIQKYGWNNFKHEILKDDLTIEEANFWEEFYIKHRLAALKRLENPEYKKMISKGFIKKGHTKSQSHRLAISEAAKKRWQEFRRNKDE